MTQRVPTSETGFELAWSGRRNFQIALWAALGLLFLLNYAWTFYDLITAWVARERMIFGLVVLAGAAFLVWDRRRKLAQAQIKPSRWGLAFIGFSLFLVFVGTRALFVVRGAYLSSVFLRGVSLVAFLCGATLLFFGADVMRLLWLPFTLLLFIHPENYLTSYWVPLRLQTLAAVTSEKVVSLLGSPVVREGHVLETANFRANVEEACSGIRSLMTVVPTALFIGAYSLRKPGAQIALVLLAIPLTVLANVFRVSMTILLGVHVGTKAAEGFFHYFAGMGIFLLCLVGLLLLVKLLTSAEKRRQTRESQINGRSLEEGTVHGTGVVSAPHVPKRALLAAGGVLLLGVIYQGLEIFGEHAKVRGYSAARLTAIPKRIGKWTGGDLDLNSEALRGRDPTSWLYREYRTPGELPIQVLVFYWKAGAGTLMNRRWHPAEGCYPYHGLKEESTQIAHVPTNSRLIPQLILRHSIFSHPSGKLLVTSYQQAGTQAVSELLGRRKRYVKTLASVAREILGLGERHPPELAFQFITPLGGSADPIFSMHRDFAALFVAETMTVTMGWEEAQETGE